LDFISEGKSAIRESVVLMTGFTLMREKVKLARRSAWKGFPRRD